MHPNNGWRITKLFDLPLKKKKEEKKAQDTKGKELSKAKNNILFQICLIRKWVRAV